MKVTSLTFTVLAICVMTVIAVDCGGGASCPSGSTCCSTASGGWGCCPTPDATCCSDHIHCCPSNYPVCDTSAGECKASSSDLYGIPLLTKKAAEMTIQPADDEPALSEDIVAAVNRNHAGTWSARLNENFRGWTMKEMKRSLGTILEDTSRLPQSAHTETIESMPSTFDARQQWPGCVGPVLNQAKCGSCWAFACAESVSDRMCIEKRVSKFLQLAPLDLVSCDSGFFNNGCEGGMPSAAWDYVQSTGLVTEECLPYLQSEGGPIPTCAPKDQPCLNFVSTPPCTGSCHNSSISYTGDKHKIGSTYGVTGEQQMMAELIKNGPFEVTMTVYADFPHYKSGVYQHQTGQALGGHAIKVIGYGTESGTPYWLIQNSWTTTWGDDGLFMIRRGDNECGIESGGVAGTF